MNSNFSDAYYSDKQISSRFMELVIKKPKNQKIAIYVSCSIIFLYASFCLYNRPGVAQYFYISIFLGCISFFLLCVETYLVIINDLKSKKIFKVLRDGFIGKERPDVVGIKAILSSIKLKEAYRQYAYLKFYKEYLLSVLCDQNLDQIEKENVRKAEELIGMDESKSKKVYLWAFNQAYLKIIEDKVLSRGEEEFITEMKNFLNLKDEDILTELHTLGTLLKARKIREDGLSPVEVDIKLAKGEACYHVTKGRIVKEKTLKTYQSEGVRHKLTGMVVEKEGELYLTSKRICVVGEGVQNIKLEKIFNVEIDIDRNLITLDIDGRSASLQLTVPDSLVFSAKLTKLLEK